MRSEKKLRHLDIVESHPKQNKHKNTNPKQTKNKQHPPRGSPKKREPGWNGVKHPKMPLSSELTLFDWADWTRRCRRLPDTDFDSLLATATETVEQAFLGLLTGFLHRTLSSQDLTLQEMQYWIQSGLALSPLVATCTQYSVDFCLAWALIGEWTSRILFPVPKGPWPRHGHAGALLKEYIKPEARELLHGLGPRLSKERYLP